MHTSFTKEDKRTHYALELSAANIGERVSVLGWAQRQRDLGSLIFIDLRDRTGIVQLAFDDSCSEEIFNAAFGVRAEYVIAARGTVRRRGEGAVNPNLPTGEIEIAVDAFKVLSSAQTPPFAIVENSDLESELRLAHRSLDLRRPDMQQNIIKRSMITNISTQLFCGARLYRYRDSLPYKAHARGRERLSCPEPPPPRKVLRSSAVSSAL